MEKSHCVKISSTLSTRFTWYTPGSTNIVCPSFALLNIFAIISRLQMRHCLSVVKNRYICLFTWGLRQSYSPQSGGSLAHWRLAWQRERQGLIPSRENNSDLLKKKRSCVFPRNLKSLSFALLSSSFFFSSSTLLSSSHTLLLSTALGSTISGTYKKLQTGLMNATQFWQSAWKASRVLCNLRHLLYRPPLYLLQLYLGCRRTSLGKLCAEPEGGGYMIISQYWTGSSIWNH